MQQGRERPANAAAAAAVCCCLLPLLISQTSKLGSAQARLLSVVRKVVLLRIGKLLQLAQPPLLRVPPGCARAGRGESWMQGTW